MKRLTWILGLAAIIAIGCKRQQAVNEQGTVPGRPLTEQEQQAVNEKDTVLAGRHMSERQVMDIAFKELPQSSALRCEFKDGVWEILEVQKDVWGVSTVTTNADGKVFVTSTNATRVVLRVRDADGKVEQVNLTSPETCENPNKIDVFSIFRATFAVTCCFLEAYIFG